VNTPRSLLIAAALLAAPCFVTACAASGGVPADDAGAPDSGRVDVTEDGSGADADSDAGDDAPGRPDVSNDVVTPDVSPDAPQDGSGSDAGTEPDGFDCDEVSAECTPRAVYCVDRTTRGFCGRCGNLVSDEACDQLEVCDDSTGVAVCRACEGDECPEIIDCVPSTRSCANFQTVQVCGTDGRVESTQPCPAGRRCFDGECGPEGGVTGAACTEDRGAGGCRGLLCVCGPGWQADFGAAGCTGDLADGYCSTENCVENGCDPGNEACLAIPGSPFGDTSFCVLKAGCTSRGAACGDGFRCEELPGPVSPRADVSWTLGCWRPDVTPLGAECTSDADCLGGECRVRNVSGATVSYCASPCGADATCPSYASCVEDPDGGSGYVCLANGDGAACPRLSTQPIWMQDRTQNRYGGGQARVCYFPRSTDP
jgi:hypothetical protein